MGYFEAKKQRCYKNQEELLQLAKEVKEADSNIDIYKNKNQSIIEGLTFIKGELIKSVRFHSVPYRWSGPIKRTREVTRYLGMPYTANDIINGLCSITNVHHHHDTYFKSMEEYLKWCSYLVKL